MTANTDTEFDVVIVGSGLGGMSAALYLYEMGIRNILIIEKDDQYGGCSSIGGGGIWIPNSHYAKQEGMQDSFEEALDYLKATTPEGVVSEAMQATYLKHAPEALQFLVEHTDSEYESLALYPDYFSDAKGAKDGHRSLEPAPFDITRLKGKGRYLRPSHTMMSLMDRVYFTQKEAQILIGQLPGWFGLGFKLVCQYLFDLPQRLRSKRARRATCGAAGIARLAYSIEKRNIPLWLNTELTEIHQNDSAVTGISVRRDNKTITINTSKGLILASGGFEQNQQLREQYLPQPTSSQWSAGHKGNTGTPLSMAMALGAKTHAMEGAWWCTTMKVPGEDLPRLSIMEKSYPGNCVVNKEGKRIANESMNYLMYVKACHEAQAQGTPVDELWMVFDARFRKNYFCGPLLSSKMFPDFLLPKRFFDPSFLVKANSIEALSKQTGIHYQNLQNTITNMNTYAKSGVDKEFNRGGYTYDRYYGDPRVSPNNCLAPIDKAPYYAIRLYLGDFGTHGGFVLNHHAGVQDQNGQTMAGLYATGNCAAPTLPTYAGPGSTLGPAMCFAYLAARHIAQKE